MTWFDSAGEEGRFGWFCLVQWHSHWGKQNKHEFRVDAQIEHTLTLTRKHNIFRYALDRWPLCSEQRKSSVTKAHTEIANIKGCCCAPNDANQWAFEYQLKCVWLTSQRLLLIYCIERMLTLVLSFAWFCSRLGDFHCFRSYRHNSHKSNYKQTLLKHCATIKVTSSQTMLRKGSCLSLKTGQSGSEKES